MSLVMQIIILILFMVLILILNKQIRIMRLEKRFNSFSLIAKYQNETSFFDSMALIINNKMHQFSKFLNNSLFLKNYVKKYEKYISYNDKEVKDPMNYLTMKIFISIFMIILTTLMMFIRRNEFNLIIILIIFILSFYIVDILLLISFHKKRKQIEEDLLKAIIIMNNSFKAGRNIIEAIITVKNELDGPISDEFKKIYLDITYGLSLEVVFERFYERVKLEDAKYMAASLTLLNKTGGNIVRVFTSIEKAFYNKKRLNNELKSLTSASIFVFRVLVFLPFVFTLVIVFLNPNYFNPLFNTPIGILFLLIISSLYILYVLVVKKVLKVNY